VRRRRCHGRVRAARVPRPRHGHARGQTPRREGHVHAAPSGGAFDARCDNEGRYSIILFEDCRVAAVRAPLLDLPFSESIGALDADTTLDSALPARFLPLTVRAADTREPIAGARVSFGFESSGETADRLTGTDGRLRVGPLRAGSVGVAVEAAGFVPDHRRFEVPDAEPDLTPATIDLERVGDTTAVHISPPSGSPAIGAAVWIVPGLEAWPVWGAIADGRGQVDVPRRYSGVLGVRDDAAAIAVIPWSGATTRDRARSRLRRLRRRARSWHARRVVRRCPQRWCGSGSEG
jgi:hypothetical protein